MPNWAQWRLQSLSWVRGGRGGCVGRPPPRCGDRAGAAAGGGRGSPGQKLLLPGCVTRSARGGVRARREKGAGFVYFLIEHFIDKPKSTTWDRGV